jgi:heme A synthase
MFSTWGNPAQPAGWGARTDSQRAVQVAHRLMALCCDPLAIALTAVASARRSTTI